MKVLLAIDTSSVSTGVAVAVDGRVLSSGTVEKAYRHSENLFSRIDGALREAGLTREDLTGIAVTRGPGSFTGLRVGIATAKGLSHGLNLPVVGVSSLLALAEPHLGKSPVVVSAVDARKSQVYAGGYDGQGGEVLREGAWDPARLAGEVLALHRSCLIVGSGVGAYSAIFGEILKDSCAYADREAWNIDPGAVARLGYVEFAQGRVYTASTLAATYLRRSEAEENFGIPR